MCLAVGQAILACLKCGWDSVKGTNILEPALCNDQAEGDVSSPSVFFFPRAYFCEALGKSAIMLV